MLTNNHRNSSHHVYLLDTMNNVLGIFVLVLIMTLIVSATTVPGGVNTPGLRERFASLLARLGVSPEHVTDEAAGQLERQVAASASDLERAKTQLTTRPSEDDEIRQKTADARARANAVQTQLPTPPAKADLEKELATLRGTRQTLTTRLAGSREQLKSLLEKAREGDRPADFARSQKPTTRPKARPKNVAAFVLRKGKIAYVNSEALVEAVGKNALAGYVDDAKRRRVEPSLADLVKFFNSKERGDDTFTVTMEALSDGGGFALIMHPRYNSTWIDCANLDAETAWFRSKLKELDPSDTVVSFDPWSEDFDNYARMNKVALSLGFSTMWTPRDEDEELREVCRPNAPSQPSRAPYVQTP